MYGELILNENGDGMVVVLFGVATIQTVLSCPVGTTFVVEASDCPKANRSLAVPPGPPVGL